MPNICRLRALEGASLPPEVRVASRIHWGVLIDAYLTNAASVGDRYAAIAYLDRSGSISDGSTVATPPVMAVEQREHFVLLRSLSGHDHYVIASWQSLGEKP